MSAANMLDPWQWAVMAAIPVGILLLYFLKLRRQPLETPSTYLWSKSIEDMSANSIWQRLRRNLLLLLQLLIVLLVALAALRFGWNGSRLAGQRFVFLVDNSASMGAVDVAPNRLAEAKRKVGELLDQMKSGEQAMIISFADTAQVEQSFTDNRGELRRRLDAIRQTSRPTSLVEALRLASGFANSGLTAAAGGPASPGATAPPSPAVASGPAASTPPEPATAPSAPAQSAAANPAGPTATLYIVSDGNFPDVKSPMLGNLAPVFVPIGQPDAANLAVAAFSAKRPDARPDKLQIFGRLENFGPADVAAEVELHRDGSLVDATRATVKAGSSAVVSFELTDVREAALELVVQPGGQLALDDRAYAVARPARRTKTLLVTPGDEALERALESAGEVIDLQIVKPDFLATAEYRAAADSGGYDLVIYELCRPDKPPAASTLTIGQTPPGEGWSLGERVAAPQIIDVNAAHPMMSYVDMGNVIFASGQPIKPPAGAVTLMESNQGILFAVAQRDAWRDAALTAELVTPGADGTLERNTDWPLRLSFVVMLRNMLEYLGKPQDAGGGYGGLSPGQSIALDGTGERVEVRMPGGKLGAVRRDRQNKFLFSDTAQTGIYEVLEEGSTGSRFAINLFDSAESNIRPRKANILLGTTEVAREAAREGVRRETWKPLLLAALGLLILEWYIYNRRVYV